MKASTRSGLLVALALLFSVPRDAIGDGWPSPNLANPGAWTGTTSQGQAYNFTITGTNVTQIAYSYTVNCGSGSSTTNGTFPISGNAFDTGTQGFCPTFRHTGTFPTPSQGSGSITLTWTPVPFACFCSGTATLTWTATGPAGGGQPPSFTPASLTRTKGAAAANAQLGTVSDPDTPAGSLQVTLQSTATGFSVTNLLNTNGVVTADVGVACSSPVVSGNINLTISDGSSSVPGSVTVTVDPDAAPTVTPPAALTVNQSVCQGLVAGSSVSSLQAKYPAQAASLAAFLDAGTATDVCTQNPTRLTARVGGTDITNGTLFPGGTTPVTFRFQDGDGNIGTAQANVVVRRQGDLNLDGTVDLFDILALASYIVGNVQPGVPPFTASLESANCDANPTVDVFDLVLQASFVVGNTSCLTP